MNPGRFVPLAALAATVLVVAGCAAVRSAHLVDQPGPQVGIYSGRLQQPGAAARPFRLMLFVAAPDRVHGEILSPLGTPQVVLDGGGGRLAITVLEDGVTYQGPASAEALGRVLGLSLGLEGWVRGVLNGDAGESTCRVTRSPDPLGALPETLRLEAGESRLTLKLKRRRALGGSALELGTGQAPSGTQIRDLDEFVLREPE